MTTTLLAGRPVPTATTTPWVPLHELQSAEAVIELLDAEIAALKRQRDKTRLLKQGMMQELLTGRTRLV